MHEDLKWLFIVLILFGIFWFVAGGFNQSASKQPFITPSGETYGTDLTRVSGVASGPGVIPTGNQSIQNYGAMPAGGTINQRPGYIGGGQIGGTNQGGGTSVDPSRSSPLSGKIAMATTRAGSGNPASEYIALQASSNNTERVLITGLRFQSAASGRGVNVPKGVKLFFQNSINTEEPIYLAPGETAEVITGRSPLGTSFKLNKCTGFLSQFQTFNPTLPSRCPAPRSYPLPPPASQYNDQCLDYIDSLPGCRVVTPVPTNISPECQRYVSTEISYTKCVERHRNDPDFYDADWRVYLNRDDALWKSRREVIQLLDSAGKVIDITSY